VSCWQQKLAPAVERSPDDLREVGNYVVALEYGIERLKTLPLSLRLVRELHEKLMTGPRGNTPLRASFARTQNWIGRPGDTLAQASFVPPPPDSLGEHLSAWEKFLHDRIAAAACSCGASSLSIRDHSPVSGRQWPGRAVAHNA